MKIHSLMFAAALALASFAARADDSFVVPSAFTNAESPNGANGIPFLNGGNVRYQQNYLGSDVPSGPFTIYGIAFRPDHASPALTRSFASVDFYLSTHAPPLTASFAANAGGNQTLVRSGPLVLSTQATGPSEGPKDFDVEIWFDTPFSYTAGTLVLEVRVHSTEPDLFALEFISDDGDAIARVYASPGFTGGSASSASGVLDSGGLVTKFLLPEPALPANSLLALGTLAAVGMRRAHRSGASVS